MHRFLLAFLSVIASGLSAPPPVPEDPVARDLAAILSIYDGFWEKPRDPSPLVNAKAFEATAQRQRELALAFLARYPADPRRWHVVDALSPENPSFALTWRVGELMAVPATVDTAAAEAWSAQVTELKRAMAAAPDIPAELREKWAKQAVEQKEVREMVTRQLADLHSTQGQAAPEFPMFDASGRPLSLADFRGKIVVIDFWAPWCGPCREALPHLQEVAAKYRAQGVIALASCTGDTRENFDKWVAANAARFPDVIFAHDTAGKSPDAAARKLYRVSGIPAQFVIGRDGRVVDMAMGYFLGEVILEGMLANAGVAVEPDVVAQAARDRKKRDDRINGN